MRYIKLFENFQNTNFIDDFLNKVQNLLPTNFQFTWKIDIDGDQGFLFVNLSSLDTNLTLDWYIDLDNTSIKLVAWGEDNNGGDISDKSYSLKLENIEEGLELIKADVNKLVLIIERKKYTYNRILEKNIPTNTELWNSCKSWAKSKYDVWPSAYACGAAAKRYKSKGG